MNVETRNNLATAIAVAPLNVHPLNQKRVEIVRKYLRTGDRTGASDHVDDVVSYVAMTAYDFAAAASRSACRAIAADLAIPGQEKFDQVYAAAAAKSAASALAYLDRHPERFRMNVLGPLMKAAAGSLRRRRLRHPRGHSGSESEVWILGRHHLARTRADARPHPPAGRLRVIP